MRGNRKIYFAVPSDGSKALGIWGGYRYRATPGRGGGAFFLARELYPSCSESDFFRGLGCVPVCGVLIIGRLDFDATGFRARTRAERCPLYQ